MRVTCPGCGREADLEDDLPRATSFCPSKGCDYPLFWAIPEDLIAASATADGASASTLDPSLRRLPGTGGQVDASGIACWNCSEGNPKGAVICWRCKVELDPTPVVEEDEEPPPPPDPEPEPEPPFPIGLVVAAAVGLLALLVVAVVWGTRAFAAVAVLGAAAGVAVAWPRFRR